VIVGLKHIGVTTLTFQGQVTSSAQPVIHVGLSTSCSCE